MKTNRKILLAVTASLSIGVTAGYRANHAQQIQVPPVCIISEAATVTDDAALKAYGAKVGETLAPFKGHYHFVAGGKAQSLDGDPPPTGIVVIEFDSADQAHAWYQSPAYQAIKPLRLAGAKGRMFMVQGVAAH